MQLMKMKILSFSFVFVFILYSYAMRDDLINGKQYKAILCPISTFLRISIQILGCVKNCIWMEYLLILQWIIN